MKSPRPNTLPLLATTPINPMEAGVEYIDANGVLRRSTSVTKRMMLRGSTVGSSENLFKCSDGDLTCEPAGPDEDVLAIDKTTEILRQKQCEIDQENRKKMLDAKKERKKKLYLAMNETEGKRLQQWHDTLEADPTSETTAVRNNGPESPSRKALSFVDKDGNLRHRVSSADSNKSTDASSSSPGSPVHQSPSYLQTSTPKKEQSSIWNFVRGMIDPPEKPFSEV